MIRLVLAFWDSVLYSTTWPWTPDVPTSSSQYPGLQIYIQSHYIQFYFNKLLYFCLSKFYIRVYVWLIFACLFNLGFYFILFLIKKITVNLMVCDNFNEKRNKKAQAYFSLSIFSLPPVSVAFRRGYGGAALLEKVHPLEIALRVKSLHYLLFTVSDSSLWSKMWSLFPVSVHLLPCLLQRWCFIPMEL